METTYTIYNTDGTMERGSVDWPREPDYHKHIHPLVELQVLGGEWFEHVYLAVDGSRISMFVDDSGMIKGLPINERATMLFNTYSGRKGQYIYGPAIVFDRNVMY